MLGQCFVLSTGPIGYWKSRPHWLQQNCQNIENEQILTSLNQGPQILMRAPKLLRLGARLAPNKRNFMFTPAQCTGKMAKNNPCQGKHREFGNFARKQGILFAQVLNSLILKVKDISILAVKISKFLLKLKSAASVLCHKWCKSAQGKFAIRQGIFAIGQGIWKYNLSGYSDYRMNVIPTNRSPRF